MSFLTPSRCALWSSEIFRIIQLSFCIFSNLIPCDLLQNMFYLYFMDGVFIQRSQKSSRVGSFYHADSSQVLSSGHQAWGRVLHILSHLAISSTPTPAPISQMMEITWNFTWLSNNSACFNLSKCSMYVCICI